MRSDLARAVRLAVTGALVVALAGCSDNSPRPPIVVITPEPVRGIIAQLPLSGFEADVWIQIPLILSQRGVLDVTVDWTFPDTWMYVYFGQSSCDYAQLTGRTCPFTISSETQGPKPRVLYTVTLEPATYYLVLYNVPYDRKTGIGSWNVESVSIQLGLTIRAEGERSTDAVRLGRPIIVPRPRL
jgi:hypothetical protein